MWAHDPSTGQTALKPVTDVIPRHEREIWEVTVTGADGASETFETTEEHPWWVLDDAGNGMWLETGELTATETVITQDGRTLSLASVLKTERFDGTYNLTVADFETYFVGEQRVLVHNCITKARRILDHVRRTGEAPEGYVGGRQFKNREGLLPSRGSYREYDIDPKPLTGSRNSQRIVVDTNSGRAWYTSDHYRSFTEIK